MSRSAHLFVLHECVLLEMAAILHPANQLDPVLLGSGVNNGSLARFDINPIMRMNHAPPCPVEAAL